MLSLLLKMAVQTRDIIDGKGEYDLAYMQILEIYKFYPEVAFKCFKLFVSHEDNPLSHQYGSWKDIKRFCQYIKDNSPEGEDHPLIKSILEFSILELNKRYSASRNNPDFKPDLIGKWLPREKSKYKWIFKMMARMNSPQFMDSANTLDKMRKATKKQRMTLRKMLSHLNKKVDTVQIKMCDTEECWSQINFNNVTSLTLSKSKRAILYVDKKGNIRGESKDRLACRSNYQQHIEEAMNGNTSKKIHGKRCQVGELVRDALSISNTSSNNVIRNTVNMQWESNKENNMGLKGKSIVCCCDVSGSMEVDNCTPLNNAIGLSIRISELVDENSGFKNRILTFDSRPTWIQLNDSMSFVEKAKTVKKSSWGTNTDFHLALDKILQVLVENNVHPNIVSQLIFAVFSDMQFDSNYHNAHIFDTAEEAINKKFAEAGLNTKWRQPYSMPHILFWNLRKTSGFPAQSTSKNITFLSGYSSTLINIFCDKGIDALRETTPITMLRDLLNTDRYNIVDSFIN